MALDQKEVTINGKQWVIQQLPATQGMEVGFQILHIASGMAEGVGFFNGEDWGDVPINVGGLVAGVIKKMPPKDMSKFVKDLVLQSVIRPNLKEGDLYEAQFSGNFSELFELVEKIIEHNNLMEPVKKNLAPIIKQLFDIGQNHGKSTPSSVAP